MCDLVKRKGRKDFAKNAKNYDNSLPSLFTTLLIPSFKSLTLKLINNPNFKLDSFK